MPTHEQPTHLEISTIRPIPLDERHGTSADLFTIWFGSNLMLLTIVAGFPVLGPADFPGLDPL
jgi:NCS1 family nucleobase:cation symporter-1